MNAVQQRLHQALDALQRPQADMDYRPGHERVQQLLSKLELSSPMLRIRVAGTNGKGSTCHMLANGLASSSLRIGLYTSPHILCFNERIRINGVAVADADLLHALDTILPIAEAIGTSPFETATALALYVFDQQQVDIQIIEAGVGARLDTSTAIDADMALITPISLDHQAWLGETEEAIAIEKSYAMLGCRWALTVKDTQTPAVLAVLQQRASQLQCVALNPQLRCAMQGRHQQSNASLALAAIAQLESAGVLHTNHAVAAVEATTVVGRMQKIMIGNATLWLDAAHNMHAIESLLPFLPSLASPFDAIVIAPREDRALTAAIALLTPFANRVLYQQQNLTQHQAAVRTVVFQAINYNPEGHYLLLGSFHSVAAMLQVVADVD